MSAGLVLALLAGAAAADTPAPLPRAHAHNDYEHGRPLLDALDHGFASIEADIWLTEKGLQVAHTPLGLRNDRTLESLYLDPLRARAKANGGKIHATGNFYLMIDVKTEAGPTYAALAKVLASYSDILTVTRDGKAEAKAVTVVISGNRDAMTLAAEKVRYAALDGRPADLDGDSPVSLVPWVSDSWKTQFKWDGTGPMPDAERKKLRELVAKAHKQGRKVRFWATPESSAVWKELLAADVDFLSTDRLADLAKFLRENDPPKP